MTRKILEVADEIATQLAELLSLPAKRVYVLPAKRQGNELYLAVAPASDKRTIGVREANDKELRIDIGYMKACDPDDVEQVDGLMNEVDGIIALWEEGGPLREVKLAGCEWVGLENDPVYVYEHLVDKAQFTSVISVTYRDNA